MDLVGRAANEGARTCVNPEIEWASPETIQHREGGVSMPGVNDEVLRHARVRINYQDVDGTMQAEESDGQSTDDETVTTYR